MLVHIKLLFPTIEYAFYRYPIQRYLLYFINSNNFY